MASQKFISFTFLFLATIASALNYEVAETHTNNFCKTAEDKNLCNTLISGVNNWHDANGNAF